MKIEVPQPETSSHLKIVPMNAEVAESLEFTRKKTTSEPCRALRHQMELDEQTRTMRCMKCGYVIDPFDYLLQWAKECDREVEGLKSIRIQKKITKAEHEELEREVKNLRATLKRHGKPQSKERAEHFNVLRWNPHLAEKELKG